MLMFDNACATSLLRFPRLLPQPGQPHELDGDTAASQLLVDISDALSEREKVKFTVHTKVSQPGLMLGLWSVRVCSTICTSLCAYLDCLTDWNPQ